MCAVVVAFLVLAQLAGGCAGGADVTGAAEARRQGDTQPEAVPNPRYAPIAAPESGGSALDDDALPLTRFVLADGLQVAVYVDDLEAPERGVLAVWDAGAEPTVDAPTWTSPLYDLWWAAPARLDAETEFVVLGMWSTRERHASEPDRHRTVRVLRWDGHAFVEVWRGSALARPMRDFDVVDVNRDGIDELRVEEAPGALDGATHGIHRWTGFGFSRDP